MPKKRQLPVPETFEVDDPTTVIGDRSNLAPTDEAPMPSRPEGRLGRLDRDTVIVIALPALVLLLALILWLTQTPPWVWGLLTVTLAAGATVLWQRWTRARTAMQSAEAGLLQAQNHQKHREQQFLAAQKMGALGMWEQDVRSQSFDWSPGTFKLFGIQPELGVPSQQGFLICVHPEDQPRWRDAHRRAVQTGQEARVEYRYIRRGSDTIWVRSIARARRGADGSVVRLAGIVQDISGIRAMQQQVAASERKFRELTSLSSDWIWETDHQHRICYISDSVDAVLGTWARQRIGRRRWEEPIRLMTVDWDAHRRMLDARKPVENFEFGMLDPEGHVFFVSVSGRPSFTATGEFVGYRGVGRNITREKHQRQLLELEADVAQIMRDHNSPERVIEGLIVTLTKRQHWLGGAFLVRNPSGVLHLRQRRGYRRFIETLDALPHDVAPPPGSVEALAWEGGRPVWIHDINQHPDLVERYQTRRIGARAVFLAPIREETGTVMAMLMFFSPLSHRDDDFLEDVGESLSRTLSLYLQRKAAEERLTHASLHDALTGLPNRIFLTHQLSERLAKAQPLALLYVDLDRYKIINDTLGHSVGDQVLIEVARRFRDSIGPDDVAGRMGGDEFIILLGNTRDRAHVESMARRILANIEKPFILNNSPHFLSASIGVGLAPDDSSDAKLLIKCADAAMYEVKSAGRNDVRFFAGGLVDERDEMLQLASDLPLAIRRGEVDLHYQPIFAVDSRSVVGLEALMRWNHPTRGLLLPDKFLPLAEQSSVMRELGLWAVQRAIEERVALGVERHPDLAVSVNVSPRQIAEEGFLATINELLTSRRLPARLLRLELTESGLIESPERTITVIGHLRQIGVSVLIDNFGTGYASMAYLKNLPVDGLKIDRTFVKDLATDRGNAAIVQAVTTLAAKLGLQAMAEGVETAEELRALRSYHCDQMQGTLISEPLPFARIEPFLQSLPALRQMHLVRDSKAS